MQCTWSTVPWNNILFLVYVVYNMFNLSAQFFVVVAMVGYGVDVFLQVLDIRHKFVANASESRDSQQQVPAVQ